MKIKAKSLIVEFDDGQMVVINPGETGELSDAKAEQKIADGLAARVSRLPQLDHDGNGAPGGSSPGGAATDLAPLRAEYEAKLGKKPFNGWDGDELRRRIAEHEAGGSSPGGAADEGAAADAPPAE